MSIKFSLGLWRKESKFVIKGKYGGVPVDLLYNTCEEDDECYQKKSSFYKEWKYPVRNLALDLYAKEFFIQSRHKQLNPVLDIQQAQEIITWRFGNSLQHLELFGYPIVTRFQFGIYFPQLFHHFPNLKTLTMEPLLQFKSDISLEPNGSYKDAHNLKAFNIDLNLVGIGVDVAKAFLNSTPNIKKLQLKGFACVDFLQALKFKLVTTGSHVLLENLKIDPDGMPGYAIARSYTHLKAYLDAAHPPLRTLKASVREFTHEGEGGRLISLRRDFLLKEFISTVEGTLTCLDLRVTVSYNPWVRVLDGCALANLSKLFIRRSYMCNEDLELKFDFGTLRGTPRLKVFHCGFEFINPTDKQQKIVVGFDGNEVECTSGGFPLEPVLLEHLEDFRFDMYQKPTPECWRKFAGMMPNLQKVEAIFNEKTLPLVLQLWPGLRQCLINPRSKRFIKKKTISKLQAERGQTIKIEFAEVCKKDWDKW